MKRYILQSKLQIAEDKEDRVISFNDIYKYINELNDSSGHPLATYQIITIADKLNADIYRKERARNEWYASLEDADILNLLYNNNEIKHLVDMLDI